MHTFCSFFEKKITVVSDKNNLYWQPILKKKLIHLRFWSDGAGLRTEAQKFFNTRTMHTT